ncbi:sulfurtransferase-like selenium metabolism protein YedF [Spirochaeta isovalerica]|uniref:Selenium metabolism protein YedF n=1 Tax=Spirochaeta isovalerica TaxID=150 RepID=A0A841R9G0_9SPIO|nr:sulfurtransferase-like selenium metabolism protein YedF [Spirochaeta isovalerica]MBB6479579.1 selenium metabolism protein YedF [Spirochaeta isovalerica]
MKKSINGTGLACPQPVIRVKQAFDEGGFSVLEIQVDNQAAVENVTRFCENSGHAILSVTQEGEIRTITIDNEGYKEGDAPPAEPSFQFAEIQKGSAEEPLNIFINAETIGQGDPKLGSKLMEAFIYSLTEIERRPDNILMMNGGVKVAVEGSPCIGNLKDLEESGITIYVCGACLDFYGMKEQLAVGKVSNMYEIASILTGKGNTVTVG